MYAIETDNLVKSFKGFKAVDGISLRVPEGSIYGFLGPNGAGKTTTVKMLTGLSRPTAGQIRICGREILFGKAGILSDIGFLPDVPSFYDWMTAPEFLKFAGEMLEIEKKLLSDRIEYLLDLVGLSEVKKKIGGFSRGMKQRLGIAQAMINQPKVLFLDEPTSALDPIGRKEVIDIIASLAGKMTVFFSTHILSDVERVCDRVVILNRGKTVIEDSMENLRKNFAYRTIQLEVDAVRKTELMQSLSAAAWVEKLADAGNGGLNIKVNDMDAAQHDIPSIISGMGIGLRKFLITEPTLEDIFMKVVKEE